MIHQHPYIRYAQALLIVENQLKSIDDISMEHIKTEIKKGLDAFCVEPAESYENKKTVKFRFINDKSSAKLFKYLAPNSITSDMQARNLYNSATDYLKTAKELDKSCEGGLTMASMPIAGEFCSFSDKGGVGRGKTSCTIYEQGLALITSLTPLKPCLQYRIDKKEKPELFNVCIIPDITVEALTDFVKLFKRLIEQKLDSDLMMGNVVEEIKGKNKEYKPKRPHIFQGNFPNPPRSSAMGSIALLSAIGEMAKESDVSEWAFRVLESLKDSTYYMVQYGNAQTFTYNHYVVELAQKSKLKTIVDSIYYSELYNEEHRTSKSTEYQKFDLLASRFLMLFNPSSFRGFLSFRAEYPKQVELLLTTYFTKMTEIDLDIVHSAKELGRWLNQTAYFAAKDEVGEPKGSSKEDINKYWNAIRKVKSKVLVELESSIFSAKSGDALIAHAVTRAGRISRLDAPENAALFMEKTASGELELENAKNLLIAFSRIKNKKESEEQPTDVTTALGEDNYDNEDLSEI